MLFELWWIAPALVGVVGVVSVTAHVRGRRRRLGFDAAKQELAAARSDAVAKTAALRMARAELARTSAERTAARAGDADLSRAKQHLREAEQNA
ncbi:MAG: hypothetical protein WA971_05540, partial [Microbacterium sp.]